MKRLFVVFSAVYLGLILLAGFGCLFVFDLTSDLSKVLVGPSLLHPFGFDSLGRDLLVRSLSGFFMSFTLALAATAIAAVVGLGLGGIAGLRGGWVDLILMRLIDVLEALPDLLLSAVLLLLWRLVAPYETPTSQFMGLALALGLTGWLDLARQMRTLSLRERSMPYLEAAFALGASGPRRLVKHLWPNIKNSLLLLMFLQIPGYMLFEATLSFFGLGLKPPQPSLGQILLEGWKILSVSSHVILGPTLLLFFALLSFQFLIRSQSGRRHRIRFLETPELASPQRPVQESLPQKY